MADVVGGPQPARSRRGGDRARPRARAMSSCDPADAQPQGLPGDGGPVGHLGDGWHGRRRGGDELGQGAVVADRAGGTSASTTGSRATSSSSGAPSACARAIASRASEAPVTLAAAADGISSPTSASWPCRLTSVRRPLRSSASSCSSRRSSSDGTAARSSSTWATRSVGQVGERAAQPADPPRRPQAAGRRPGIEAPQQPAARRLEAEQGRGRRRRCRRRRRRRRCRGRPAWSTCRPAAAPRAGRRAAGRATGPARAADSGSGNDSATGPGPNTVPEVGGSVVIGRACSRRRLAGGVDGPLDVLRAAEGATGVGREAGELAQHGGRRTRGVAPVERTSTTRPRRLTTAVQPSTAPDTSWSGPPGTAATTMRSWRPVSGSAPNSTPPHTACSIGCTRTAISASTRPACAGPVGGGVDLLDGREQRPLAGDVEDRLEHAGHRRGVAVLAGRRRPHDDRLRPVGGDVPPREQRLVACGARSTLWSARRRAGSGARPHAPAARLAAFAPTSAASVARGSESGTTVGRVTTSTA